MSGKRFFLMAGAVLLYLTVTLWGSDLLPVSRNIAQIKLIRTMAVDTGADGGVRLTVSGDVQKQSPDGETRPPLILTREAQTVFSGCLRLQEDSEGYLEFGHLAECVVGEDYARGGMEGLGDYLERDVSMRTETKLFVVAGDTAEAAVRGTGSKDSAMTKILTSISRNRSLEEYTVREYISQQEDNGVALLPVLTLENNPEYDPASPDPQPELSVRQWALGWFRDQRLVGVLTEEESQGVSLLTDNDRLDYPIEVTLPDGTVAGIRLIDAACRLEPEFASDGTLVRLTARVTAQGDLNELRGWADPLDEATLAALERGFQAQVEKRCQAALDRSMEEGADFLHLRRTLVCQCPLRARALTEQWDTWFPTLELKASAQCSVRRSYDIDRPVS